MSKELLKEIKGYINQVEKDFKAIEKEILTTDSSKPQRFDDWTSPANTMRQGARIKDKILKELG